MKWLRGVPSKGPARRLVGVAVALAAVVVVEAAVRVAVSPSLAAGFTRDFLVGIATSLPFLAGVAYVGVWLAASDVDATRHGRVLWWTVVATLGSVAVNVLLMAVLPTASTWQAVSWLRWAVAAGAGVGALVGVTEARAVQNASDAARSEARAAHLEQERDRLDYLNSLLRHEVLNAANEISGYASLLREDSDPDSRVFDYSGRIDERTDALTSVIDDVRVLLQASREPDAVDTVDAVAVVVEEATRLEATCDAASTSVDAPHAAPVAADRLVSRAVRAVLENAVEHDDADETSISIVVEATLDWVTVRVSDDGNGISEETRETLFDRPSRRTADHPLGLYIAARIVEGYGGGIELTETGEDGSTFELRLPADGGDEAAALQVGGERAADLD